jgi:DNA end-binding protein Ku
MEPVIGGRFPARDPDVELRAIVMAPRSSWKGFIRLNLVSVPVKGYTATSSGGGEVALNQIHSACNSRIKYQKHCPIHGEVPKEEIVSGFEIAKDQYVMIDPAEVDKLRSESDKAVTIDAFIPQDKLDPIYFSGKNYYLVPDGPVAFRPYALLVAGIKEQGVCGIARVVMHSRDQLVLLRPIDRLLAMSILNFETQLVKPSTFEAEVPAQDVGSDELKLVNMLIKATTPKAVDLAQYKDTYSDKLTKLIEAKVAGKEIITPPSQEAGQVVNLMDALKASLARMQGTETAVKKADTKPPKKAAKSKASPPAEVKKKKKSS